MTDAELDKLVAQRLKWSGVSHAQSFIDDLCNAITALRERVAELEADAERYRFLRDQCDTSWQPAKLTAKLPAAMIDAAIDAARRAGKGEPT